MVVVGARLFIRVARLTVTLMLCTAVPLGCADSIERGLQQTSLCDLVREGPAADGQQVELTARYTTDRTAIATLHDDRCPERAVPATIIVDLRQFAGELSPTEQEVMDTFADADSEVSVELDLLGTFLWRPESNPQGGIIIERVSGVRP